MNRNPYLPQDRAQEAKEEGTNIEQEEAKEHLTQQEAHDEKTAPGRSVRDYIDEEAAARDEEE